MVKKRVKKSARRTVSPRAKFMPYSKTANILALIAVCLLVINSILLIFLKDRVISALSAAGIASSSSQLAIMGLMWLLIAFFAWSINRTIKEKQMKVSMWELFILSIVTMLSGRLESGVFLLIASIIYLVKAKKK